MPIRSSSKPLKPRKTPGQQRATATVAAIVEAAAHILETAGLDGYTTNAVAARAGASIGSLYQYFPNKDAITRALIERETAALFADISLIELSPDGAQGLRQLIAAGVKHQLQRPKLARLLDLEELRLPLAEDIGQARHRLAAVLQRCLVAVTPLSAVDEYVVDDLLAIMKGMVDAAGQRGELDQPTLLARVERAVFGYLDGPRKQ